MQNVRRTFVVGQEPDYHGGHRIGFYLVLRVHFREYHSHLVSRFTSGGHWGVGVGVYRRIKGYMGWHPIGTTLTGIAQRADRQIKHKVNRHLTTSNSLFVPVQLLLLFLWLDWL